MLLSIIIPVYNEKETIEKTLAAVNAVDLGDIHKEIIIIDDGSVDGTREILERLKDQYKIILKDKNEGKGSAIQVGFKNSTGDITLIQDADLEYDPSEYPKLIQPIINNHADVVFSSRFIGSEPHRVLYFWHSAANRFLTLLSNLFGNLVLTDMESGYKVFNRQALDLIKNSLTAKRFGIEPEIVALVAKHKNQLRIYEVGISYYGRTYAQGKKINWRDGLAALFHVIRFNLFK